MADNSSGIHLYVALKTLFQILANLWDDGGKRIQLGERAQYACLDPEERPEEQQDDARTTLLRESDEGEMV